jgi:hypothetical protein
MPPTPDETGERALAGRKGLAGGEASTLTLLRGLPPEA